MAKKQKTKKADAELIDKLSDVNWRLSNLYWVVDEKGQTVLFQPNYVQQKLLASLHDMNLVLKSRQHGITTFFCILALDSCLFYENFKAGIIAHNQDDAKSFFRDKVKFAFDHLHPPLLERLGITPDLSSAKEISFSNNSNIRVGTALRSATLNFLHVSEFGKISARAPDKAREIVTGAFNTLHEGSMVSVESTAEGNSGYFYDYCIAAQNLKKEGKALTRLDFKFFFFPWHEDPRNTLPHPNSVVITTRLQEYFKDIERICGITLSVYQKAWYAKKESILGEDMRREHPSTPEESFQMAIHGAYFKPQFDRIYREKRITAIPYEDGIPVHTAWDLGRSDQTAILFFQLYGGQVRFIDFVENSGEGLPYYARILRDKPYEYGIHYAPHDINVHDYSISNTRLEQAQTYGIYFEPVPRAPKDDQIEAARSLLGRSWFDEEKCEMLVTHLTSYRHEWDDKNGCWKEKPRHDIHSDAADAFMVAAVAGVDATKDNAYESDIDSYMASYMSQRMVA